ncbi:POK11 protein, partial [Dicaeum eximium]|nr:POK11 protein [Dicaeum eximium]
PMNWRSEEPVWVDQWPLSIDKLRALESLIEEQVSKGHLAPSTSPWNTPVFVVKKRGGDRWRLLQDLRAINEVLEDMGSLQPGMPSPSMLPRDWKLAVIDLKDCFFSIPLNPRDTPKFAFSVPSINCQAPMKRYEWLVLPQGCKNSPTLCQRHVANILAPVRKMFPDIMILHYMDDILVCAREQFYLDIALKKTISTLEGAGFAISQNKVQLTSPFKYLGLLVCERTIVPQHFQIMDNPKTLQEMMQLCGSINWLRPLLGIPNQDLEPLFDLLKGDSMLTSPRTLTTRAKFALQRVADAIATRKAHWIDPVLPFQFAILGECPHFYGMLFQWDQWIFTPHTPKKTITTPTEVVADLISKARSRLRVLAGCDLACIHVPWRKAEFESIWQSNSTFQLALDSYSGQVSTHYPKHRLFKETFQLAPKSMKSKTPLAALNMFTDGSGKSKKSAIVWMDPTTRQWEADVEEVEGSPQIIELAAVVRAFKMFNHTAINLITDSAYVAGVVDRAENSLLKQIDNPKLFDLLSQLVILLSHRKQKYYVMHVRSHADLPGP